jgi:hydroxypyruvate reductase
MNAIDQLQQQALSIFEDALAACDIDRAFDRHLHFEGKTLVLHPWETGETRRIALDQYKRLVVIAFGKAGASMLTALMQRMPEGIDVRGLCSSPKPPEIKYRHFKFFAGGHPLPNQDSLAAGEEALHILRKAKKDTFVLYLISGGGSAMLEAPLDTRISIEDIRAFHETLVASGASITEVNAVRRFFSAVKGGRLAKAASSSDKLTLLLADVPLREIEAVASSPTLPNQTQLGGCEEVLERFQLLDVFPASVRRFFEHLSAGKSDLPPSLEDKAFRNSDFRVLLSNHDFVDAAQAAAEALGYEVTVDNSCDDWDYEAASRYLLDRFHALRTQSPRTCLISSGELSVKLPDEHGCGGRNQQFALACAFDLARYEGLPMVALSAGSDGIDGNSPAAGAIADTTTLARARQQNFNPETHRLNFDACPLFTAIGDSIVTGSTGNNLRDLRVFLADPMPGNSVSQIIEQ